MGEYHQRQMGLRTYRWRIRLCGSSNLAPYGCDLEIYERIDGHWVEVHNEWFRRCAKAEDFVREWFRATEDNLEEEFFRRAYAVRV